VYVDGKVRSNGVVSNPFTASRDMEGDSLELGWNLAATVRPLDNMNVSVTYRSNVDLDIEGDAELATSLVLPGVDSTYSGSTGVPIPLPAVLAVAVSYTFFDQLTVELEYDRTYWSEYDQLDFTYPVTLTNPVLSGAFDDVKPKNWKDTDAWRLSFSYDMKNNFILMAGIAYDENPAPSGTLGFELPDSDAMLYSVGLRYAISEDMEIGIAYLYDDKESRTVLNRTVAEPGNINGTFDDASAHLVTVGFSYKL